MKSMENTTTLPGYSECRLPIASFRRRIRFVDEVRRRIAAQPGQIPNLEKVAAELAMSPRTLRRRLAAEGSNFQLVLDEVRLNLAKDYLAKSALPIFAIAELLGFKDSSNFSNAFKRWCGVSPGAFRQSGVQAELITMPASLGSALEHLHRTL